MNTGNVDTGIGWVEKTLQMVEKYRIWTILKAILVVLLIALVVGFISNPTYIFEKYKEYEDKKHTEAIENRLHNNEKIHILCEKLMYRVDADRVMLLELHNSGTNLNGLPFVKASAIYESLNEGIYPVSGQYQQVQLSLMPFSIHLFKSGYWCGDTDELLEIDKGLYHKMKGNGTEHFAACLIEGVDTPLAFLIVSFKDLPEHDCLEVRENIRHISLELALLLELGKQ